MSCQLGHSGKWGIVSLIQAPMGLHTERSLNGYRLIVAFLGVY
uniref:Uncharacterized protein n=1 Tax=Rhizophora mucronata TaxID=61149 RepID=A0A2P2PP86_RHIMU